MSKELIAGILAGVIGLVLLVGFVVHLVRGEVKDYVKIKMAEAEEKFKNLPKPEKSKQKLMYVLEAVKEKYKFAEIFLNIKKFIEVVAASSKINK